MQLRVAYSTGARAELYLDPRTTVEELKELLDEREGLRPGRCAVYRLRTTRTPRHAIAHTTDPGARKLSAATRALQNALTHLPAESDGRFEVLGEWVRSIEARSGAVEEDAGRPLPALLAQSDSATLHQCALQDGEQIFYGPWAAADATSAGTIQRTERTAGEHRRRLDALLGVGPVARGRRRRMERAAVRIQACQRGRSVRKQHPGLHSSRSTAVAGPAGAEGGTDDAAALGRQRSRAGSPSLGGSVHAITVARSSGAAIRALKGKLGKQLREATHRGSAAPEVERLCLEGPGGALVDDPDPDDRSTALMIAVSRGGSSPCASQREAYNALVELFLKHGADPNLADARGWTAMHRAASVGNERALRAMRAGACMHDSCHATMVTTNDEDDEAVPPPPAELLRGRAGASSPLSGSELSAVTVIATALSLAQRTY